MKLDLKHFTARSLAVFLLLPVVIAIAHFWHYQSFGLYEDDLFRIPRVIGGDWHQLGTILAEGSPQGRPLHDGLVYLFSFLGLQLGGLTGIYLVGFVIITLNAFLFYTLLRRLSSQPFFALTGTLAFCLFPADTTRIYLTHSLGIQPSLLFLLIALHLYIGKSHLRPWSYLAIFGSLLCYETFFSVFLAAPLLTREQRPQLRHHFIRHALILAILMMVMIGIRKVTVGSIGVVTHPSVETILYPSVKNVLLGPIRSLSLFFLVRPLTALSGWPLEKLLLLPICFLVLGWFLARQVGGTSDLAFSWEAAKGPRWFQPIGLTSNPPLSRLVLAGTALLILAYPLTLTTSATAGYGRGSRVHAAAVVGAALLCACLCTGLLTAAQTLGQKRGVSLVVAGFFTLLVGFGLNVQQDYKLGWQYQQKFWADLVRLCPDITANTVILTDPTGLPKPKQIQPYGWSVPLVLGSLYQFPAHWPSIPRVYLLQPQWQQKIVGPEGQFQVDRVAVDWIPWLRGPREATVDSHQVILLEADHGQLSRHPSPVLIGDRAFPLQQPNTAIALPLSPGPLYPYLMPSS